MPLRRHTMLRSVPTYSIVPTGHSVAPGMGPDIGVKTLRDSINELNGMVFTTTTKASASAMGTARNCGNIKSRSGGNSATSSGTSATEILMLPTVQRMDRRVMDGRTTIKFARSFDFEMGRPQKLSRPSGLSFLDGTPDVLRVTSTASTKWRCRSETYFKNI